MKTIRPILFLLAIFVLVAGCKKKEAPAAGNTASGAPANLRIDSKDPVDLRAKFTPGTRYVFRMDLDQGLNLMAGNTPIEQKTAIGETYAITVPEAQPGTNKVVEMEFIAMEVDVQLGGKSQMAFDSKTGEGAGGDNSLNFIRKLMGQKLKMTLDSSNKVETIEGFPQLVATLNEGQSAQSKQMVSQFVNEEMFKSMVDFARFQPNHLVKVGESWDLSTEIPLGAMGRTTINLKSKFEQWEQHDNKKTALINFTGTMNAATQAMGAVTIKFDNAKLSGKGWFDPEVGTSVDSTIDQEFDLEIHQGNAAAAPMKAKMNQKIIHKLVDVAKISQ